MTCIGKVSKGAVILPPEIKLPEGMELMVTIPDVANPDETIAPTLEELFSPVAGKATGLPTDMAENHDHYLHGVRKRRHSWD